MKPYNTKEDAEAIGRRIRAVRKSEGLTQEKLSEILSVGVGHMGKAERGKETLSTSVLIKFCLEFHVSLDELILGTRLKSEAPEQIPPIYRSGIPELLEGCDEMEKGYVKLLILNTLKHIRKCKSLYSISPK
ncbi:helix-turn-helix domain-containing protein [Qiania dongpingensis]|uniref:Helix-turn-helix transcriptional regulator n=1 Tax=Qiania dongpingensis TaxID=2763669 RepID=A0A7G9G7R6_9FIRM|nr:helix-turn-helix transcriptional regulator [Qiania dongpingensis]QNM06848.1 helix-turn-helix transcriptional regulator [Qiania dongpingensis]